jgi:cytochrome c-type biogenesis protein CcmH
VNHYKRPLIITLLIITYLIIFVQTVLAQSDPPQPPTDDEVNAIAKQMYCPVCENIPLDVCPTQACTEWRELIRDKLALGWSENQIKLYFVDQYGDRVLATPPARGLNWLVYIIPPLAFFAGAFLLYKVFKGWKKPVSPGSPVETPPTIDDEYVQRLEKDLREL